MSIIEPEVLSSYKTYSIEKVQSWLQTLGFPESEQSLYLASFTANAVNGSMLDELTDQLLLDELGVTKKLHRIRILKAIQDLQNK